MSATFAELKVAVAAAIRDSGYTTFPEAEVGDMVNAALAEVGRIIPEQFQEDITPVADTLQYVPLTTDFGGAVPEIEVQRVELWDTEQTPDALVYVVPRGSGAYSPNSDAGWTQWGGTLYLPREAWTVFNGNEATYTIRVWGYCPYVPLVSDSDSANLSNEAKWALVTASKVEALERLLAERDLFTQWQTRSGNTDMSPAGLMNALNLAREEWRRRSRALTRLRSQV